MDLIKAHITKEQKEILLLLVQRRINDMERLRQMDIEEYRQLVLIKWELEQAGS